MDLRIRLRYLSQCLDHMILNFNLLHFVRSKLMIKIRSFSFDVIVGYFQRHSFTFRSFPFLTKFLDYLLFHDLVLFIFENLLLVKLNLGFLNLFLFLFHLNLFCLSLEFLFSLLPFQQILIHLWYFLSLDFLSHLLL